jgi:hypothetical protein
MNAIKSLIAVSVLAAAAGAANASVVGFTATISAQTAPLGTQTVTSGNAFTGSINVDQDTSSPTYGNLLGFNLSNTAAYVTHNSFATGTNATYAAGDSWTATIPTGGVAVSSFNPRADSSFDAIFSWGNTTTVNSNAASNFTGTVTASGIGASFITAAGAPWDQATLDVHLGSDLATILGITLVTTEKSAQGNATNTYTITPNPAAPTVPVPAAAWLFGSGILGLAGTARRRRNSEVA